MKLTGHRNLFTGDCSYLFMDSEVYNPGGGSYTARVLHDHVDRLADSGVDTLLVNPNTQLAWYPSRRNPTIFDNYKRGDRDFFRGHVPCAILAPDKHPDKVEAFLNRQVKFLDHYLDLKEAGVDWVAEIAKACRRRGISSWLSIRMNDMHGSGNPEGSCMNCSLFKNPGFRLKGTAPNPSDGVSIYWQALNYEMKEVRDHMFSLICELVEDYDYDGMELDWLRNPQCCEPPASRKTAGMITAWHAEIRALTEKKAKETGKPYHLGLRVSGNLGLIRDLGIDVKAMAEAGLIDFISPSNFWQTSWDMPHDQLLAEFGDSITIYGVIEDAPNWVPGYSPEYGRIGTRMLSASAPLLRGNAAGKLVLGADGIEQFNFFCTDSVEWGRVAGKAGGADYGALRGIEDLQVLRGKPKHYALSTFPVFGHGTWYPPYELPEQLPVILEPQWRRAFALPMCAEPAHCGLGLIIQVVVEKQKDRPDLGVSFNGSWPNFRAQATGELLFPTGIYTHHVPECSAFNFFFKASDIREGWNEIVVYNNRYFYEKITTNKQITLQGRCDNSVCIVSIELGVK